jgi:hypothetical protein
MTTEATQQTEILRIVRELAAVVGAQQELINTLRDALDCHTSPAALAQCLVHFDALKAGRPTAPAVEVPAEDPYAWL